jgi:hypothetical protein
MTGVAAIGRECLYDGSRPQLKSEGLSPSEFVLLRYHNLGCQSFAPPIGKRDLIYRFPRWRIRIILTPDMKVSHCFLIGGCVMIGIPI